VVGADYLKTDFWTLEPDSVLRASPSVLLGVSDDAAEALRAVDVHSVFDLAMARVFANAERLLEAAVRTESALARFGAAPSDVVGANGGRVEELGFDDIDVLDGVGPDLARRLTAALDVRTVRDLALWPPYRAAKKLVQQAYGLGDDPRPDPEAPPELLPRTGEYPTERITYQTLLIDDVDDDTDDLVPLGQALPSLTEIARRGGAHKPMVGAVVTLSQSWYAHGVALGQLLHSLALAPGESTRVAMLDWSRRETGAQTEDVTQTEALDNATTHSRALSEVQQAVAREAQLGFSQSTTYGRTDQSAGSSGFSFIVSFGSSSSTAETVGEATSAASSFGRRDLAAALTQNVVDSTQQQATAVRNRRASVVREVSQSEHVEASTRVVANYNHMHALTIQYYEVVQIYRTRVQVERVDRVLFVPVEPPAFDDPDEIETFQPQLRDAARSPYWRDQLERLEANAFIVPPIPREEPPSPVEDPNPVAAGAVTVSPRWNVRALERVSSILGQPVLTGDRSRLQLPRNAVVTRVSLRGAKASQWRIEAPGGQAVALADHTDSRAVLAQPLRLADIGTIGVAGAGRQPAEGTMTLRIAYGDREFDLDVPVTVEPSAEPVGTLHVDAPAPTQSLLRHLKANRAYYGEAILRRLPPALLSQALSRYTYKGAPLIAQVDATPVAVVGNLVGLRMHPEPRRADSSELSDWGQWLRDHGLDQPVVREETVPLPSGGVFAEAVLGRFNCAEKLDLTRFWNWQDSPPPLAPSDIAALSTASRATPENLQAGPLAPPLINIVTPTSLPDPAGLGAILTAVSNGNIFRDLTGLQATIGAAQAASQTSAQGATAAGQQASQNLAAAIQREIELARIAASVFGAGAGGGGGAASRANPSTLGALVNQGRQLDQRAVPAGSAAPRNGAGAAPTPSAGSNPPAGSQPGRPVPAPASGGLPVGSGSVGGVAQPSMAGYSHEAAAYNAALYGPTGEPIGNLLDAVPAVPAAYGGNGSAYGYLGSEPVQDGLDAPDSPVATWLPARAASFLGGRGPQERPVIDQVTIHTLVSPSTAEEYAQRLSTTNVRYVPHYVVGPGTAIQVVRERYQVEHGNTANATGIGIEHQGRANHPSYYTDELYRASAVLVRDICQRRGLAIDRASIRGHDEVAGSTHGDPGGYWDWEYYLALVADGDPTRLVLADGDVFADAGTAWAASAQWQRSPGTRSADHLGPFPTSSYGDLVLETTPLPDDGSATDDPAVYEVRIEREGRYVLSGWWPIRSSNNTATTVRAFSGQFGRGAATPPDGRFLRFAANVDQSTRQGRTRRTVALPATPTWMDLGAIDAVVGDTVRIEVSRLSSARGTVVADAFRLLRLS
jgi:hypothetical protein